jgi:transposase InsO family protein
MPSRSPNAALTFPFPATRRDRTEILFRGRVHTVRRETRDGEAIVLEDVESGRPETLTSAEFWIAFEAEEIVIDDEGLDKLPQRFVASIERAIDPSVERDGWDSYRRFKYCVAADDTQPSKSAKGMAPLIKSVSGAIRDPAPPSWKTIRTWLAERGTPSKRLARYMRSRHERKGRTDWLDDEVDLVVEETIDEFFKLKRQLGPKEIAEAVGGEIASRNRAHAAALGIDDVYYNALAKAERSKLGFLIAPHATTVLRRLMRHEGYETTCARSGRKAADSIFKPVLKAPKAKRVNQVWYIDHTRLDGHLVINGRKKAVLGRPWVTLVVDAFSRLIVGAFISFIPPSIHSVSAALKNAIRPKLQVAERYPDLERPWRAMGLPSKIVCDRALEFTGGSFERACAELGIEVVWCPRKNPQWKGIMERTNRTFNTDFVDLMPGATRDARKRKQTEDRDPADEAELEYEDLDRHLHRWLVCVYPRKVHTGIGRKPGDVYDEGLLARRPDAPRRASDLDVLGFSFVRTLSRQGVLFLGLRYSHTKHVFDMLDNVGEGTVRVRIFVDPADLSSVIVRDPTTGQRRRLVARDPELAAMTVWERRNVLAWMREENYDLADKEKALVAKKAIRDAFTERARAKGKVAARNRAARGLGIGGEGTGPRPFTVLNRILEVDEDPWINHDFAELEDGQDVETGPDPVAPPAEAVREAPRPARAARKAVSDRKAKSGKPTIPVDAVPASPRTAPPEPAPSESVRSVPEPSDATDDGLTAAERLRARLAASRAPSLTRV